MNGEENSFAPMPGRIGWQEFSQQTELSRSRERDVCHLEERHRREMDAAPTSRAEFRRGRWTKEDGCSALLALVINGEQVGIA